MTWNQRAFRCVATEKRLERLIKLSPFDGIAWFKLVATAMFL